MKSRRVFLYILTLVIIVPFYKADFIVAMAAEQNVAYAVDPEPKPGPIEASIDEDDPEPADEDDPKPIGEPEEEAKPEPAEEPEEEAKPEPAGEPEEETKPEPTGESEEEADPEQMEKLPAEPSVDAVAGPIVEPIGEADPEQMEESAARLDSEESVSTGQELTEWLEAHKNTGGTVKLTDHVVLEETYIFCPDGMNKPAVFVDTDIYTVTVTGVAEFMSDSHLTFSGQPESKGLFYVAPGGSLSLSGIVIESSQCALWQEEGAGLVEEDCHISGSIHYADTPFVTDMDSPCIVVEKGQTLKEVLPKQIECTVNRQGRLSPHAWVLVSWNLAGTETQQEERRRFQMQGSLLHVLSAEPVQCTVVYNDYPLTFTDVKASVYCSQYLFQGWYTKQEESQPVTVMSEYSFDGENWFMSEETTSDSFFIAISAELCNRAAQPNIYIRLHGNDNGTSYFSNVLRYEIGNLECAEDIGGSRGGGTSIVNPPEEPQKSVSDTSSDEETPAGVGDRNNSSGNGGSKGSSDTEQTESGDGSRETGAADDIPSSKTGYPDSREEQKAYTEPKAADEQQQTYTEPEGAHEELFSYTEPEGAYEKLISYAGAQTVDEEQLSYMGSGSQVKEQMPRSAIRQGSQMVIAAGFVLLSVCAGIAGFFVHSRSGTNR